MIVNFTPNTILFWLAVLVWAVLMYKLAAWLQ